MTREIEPVIKLTGPALAQERAKEVTLLLRGVGREGEGKGRVSMKCVSTCIFTLGTEKGYLFLAQFPNQTRGTAATPKMMSARTRCQSEVPRPNADSSPERGSAGPTGEEREREEEGEEEKRTGGIFEEPNQKEVF